MTKAARQQNQLCCRAAFSPHGYRVRRSAGFAIGSPGAPQDVCASDQIRASRVLAAIYTTVLLLQPYLRRVAIRSWRGYIRSQAATARSEKQADNARSR
jgi:DNA-directed RNA polymerase specialized sigma24 family protein